MTTPATRPRVRIPTPPPVPRRRIVLGIVDRIDEAYTRTLRVPMGLLIALLATAAVVDLIVLVLSAIGIKAPVATRPGFKAMRTGPEFTVTPIWVNDAVGEKVEIEVHGYLVGTSLVAGDRIRATAYRQKGRDALPRAGDMENLTTGRMVRPRRATLWMHFGVPLLIQSALGTLIILGLIALWMAGSH